MSKNTSIEVSTFLSNEIIERKIYLIRRKKVMFDRDLAALYEVSTGYLNRQVKRHLDRFPEDFMFQLSAKEFKNLICQLGTSRWGGEYPDHADLHQDPRTHLGVSRQILKKS